ncbi:hypothetical protein LUZ60_008828 [Juncus effusus]|nr:hypothetical protein LUZ60_008828 [Juncus effusus]
MAENEVRILEETLETQQIAIKRLQTELDEERKASASGVEEALSMILRLQEEKSVQKMEYLQYKRVIEEKLQHDEESLAILREIIFLKDTEIEALRYQIQGYKRKLLSSCMKDPWLSGFPNLGKKNVSLPAFRLEEICSEFDGLARENFTNNFDGFEKRFFKNYKAGKIENLFRSKSSIKEIFSLDEESSFESCSSVSLHKSPRRTSSVVMLRNLCAEPGLGGDLQDIFEIPESLERTRKPNPNFVSSERNMENDTMGSNIEKIKLKIGSIENEISEMRGSDLVSLNLLKEIHNKVNLIQYQIQQKDGEIQEERENQEMQVSEIRRIPSRQRSRKEYDDFLMSYYIEAMLSFSL